MNYHFMLLIESECVPEKENLVESNPGLQQGNRFV